MRSRLAGSTAACRSRLLVAPCCCACPGRPLRWARLPPGIRRQGSSGRGLRGSGRTERCGGDIASAVLEQCVTAVTQAERSATFSGAMTAIAGSAHMAMRIDVQEQTPREALFHTITAPGLGVWRSADPGVKTYRYLKQVTNLSAPASYRAAVRFRWLNARAT